VTERFLSKVVEKYGLHPVSTSDSGTLYPQVCRFLKLNHHIHNSFEKSIIIERTIQYIKDKINSFDDYFPYSR
jgi:putative transposase